MGNEKATVEAMMKALKSVQLYDFILERDGLDTEISENASNLSGGQRQRLALARAILKDTPVYIFDEATSNIDVESENAIMEQIYKMADEKTIILISHRLANVSKADNIYVLSAGQIVQEGTHEQLLMSQGLYEKLWRNQAEFENFRTEEFTYA